MTVRWFGVWRAAVACLVLSAFAAVFAWMLTAVGKSAWMAIPAVLLVVLSSAVVLMSWRLRPLSLRWDTQRWHLGPAGTEGHEPQTGGLTVSIDLGGWMLLFFTPDDAGWWRRGTWVPVQRRGHAASWHAWRCTVYCARPISLPVVAPF
jgi:hypothetical protein